MKLGTKKFRQMLGSFQNLIAGGTRSLVRQKSQEKYLCQQTLVYCIKIIFQQRGAPGCKDVSSQDCGSLSCMDSRDKNTEQDFL